MPNVTTTQPQVPIAAPALDFDPTNGLPVNPTRFSRSPRRGLATLGRTLLAMVSMIVLSILPGMVAYFGAKALGATEELAVPLAHAVTFVAYLFAVRALRGRFEGDPDTYLAVGWDGGRAIRSVVIGLLCGAVILGTPQLVSVLSGTIQIGGPALAGVALWLRVLQIFTVSFLLQGFTEEFLWRGYLMTTLMSRWSPATAAVISAVAFGAMHVVSGGSGETVESKAWYALAAIGMGLTAAGLRLVTGSTWAAIGFHTGWHLTTRVPGLWTATVVREAPAWAEHVVGFVEIIVGAILIAVGARMAKRRVAATVAAD